MKSASTLLDINKLGRVKSAQQTVSRPGFSNRVVGPRHLLFRRPPSEGAAMPAEPPPSDASGLMERPPPDEPPGVARRRCSSDRAPAGRCGHVAARRLARGSGQSKASSIGSLPELRSCDKPCAGQTRPDFVRGEIKRGVETLVSNGRKLGPPSAGLSCPLAESIASRNASASSRRGLYRHSN